jgi:hypothetical protein
MALLFIEYVKSKDGVFLQEKHSKLRMKFAMATHIQPTLILDNHRLPPYFDTTIIWTIPSSRVIKVDQLGYDLHLSTTLTINY